jgi:hypothetical protein
MLEKCESLEVKMGELGEMGRKELGGGEYVLGVVVQRNFERPDREIKD